MAIPEIPTEAIAFKIEGNILRFQFRENLQDKDYGPDYSKFIRLVDQLNHVCDMNGFTAVTQAKNYTHLMRGILSQNNFVFKKDDDKIMFRRPSSSLHLTPWMLDNSVEGWRTISDPAKQIAFILRYLRQFASNNNWKSGTPHAPNEKSILPSRLIFRIGQIYTGMNHIPQAIKAFQTAKTANPKWNAYLDATIAFLQNDQTAFEQAAQKTNPELIDKLRRNWGKPYAQAYFNS